MIENLSFFSLQTVGIPTVPFTEIVDENQLFEDVSMHMVATRGLGQEILVEKQLCLTIEDQREFFNDVKRAFGPDVKVFAQKQSEKVAFCFSVDANSVEFDNEATEEQRALATEWIEKIKQQYALTKKVVIMVDSIDGEFVVRSLR